MVRRRMWFMLGAVALVVLALALYKGLSIYSMVKTFKQPKPPISVAAATAQEQPWQQQLPAIGTLKAIQGVDLTTEVSGTVKAVLFESGQKVALGQPLLELDSDLERASLAAAQASQSLARVEFQRGRTLVQRQSISKSQFDRLSSDLQQADASVAQLSASLAKKRILAPFAGTVGIRQLDVGAYVSPGTPVATLQDLSSLYVDFFLPEQSAPLLALGQPVQLTLAAYPEQRFSGEIVALNPKVESSTRNLQVRAQLPNPQGKLLPGMFANLAVLLPNPQPQVVVPETAVTFTLYGNALYVIRPAPAPKEGEEPPSTEDGEPSLVVERRFVETGERRNGQVVVLKGLTAGEQVVTAGQLKLDQHSAVRIEPEPTAQHRGAR
jgi:membrane fusion protein (multidrug efflux system)